MNSQHRAIRALISSMSPERATDYIKAFGLPTNEETFILEREVKGLSYVEICQRHSVSRETVKEARQRAFAKMADAIEYRKEKGRG